MVEFLTMAPTSGDTEYVGGVGNHAKVDGWTGTGSDADREPTLEYIKEIALAAEKAGFSTLLLPVGTSCLDSLMVASNLVAHTKTLNFLTAVRPGFTAPTVLAKQFTTIDRWSQGRVLLNIVTGGSPTELAGDGDFLSHTDRYHRTKEFIEILHRLFAGETFDYDGDFFTLKGAYLAIAPFKKPAIYFGGSSDIAKDIATSLSDVYMLWGETLKNTEEEIEGVKQLAQAKSRDLSYSISFQVVVGDTEEEAWAKANKLLSKADPELLKLKTEQTLKNGAVGVSRLHKLMEDSKDNNFVISPNLWAGLTQVLSGNSIALVGSPDQIAERIVEYVNLGFDKVLLRGFPHLETIVEVGEKVIPRVNALLEQKQQLVK